MKDQDNAGLAADDNDTTAVPASTAPHVAPSLSEIDAVLNCFDPCDDGEDAAELLRRIAEAFRGGSAILALPETPRDRVKEIVLLAQKRIASELGEYDCIPEWCYVAIVETVLVACAETTDPRTPAQRSLKDYRQRSNWMADPAHTGRKVVVVSLESRIAQLRERAAGSRKAYEGDYMRVPLTFLADAFDEAAQVLQSRLDAVLKAGKIDPRVNTGIPRIPSVWENAAVFASKAEEDTSKAEGK